MTPVSSFSSSSSCFAGSVAISSSGAEQPSKTESERLREPPSELVLHQSVKRSRTGEPLRVSDFAALPTMLIHEVMRCLNDKEKARLLLTSHHVHDEVQERYRLLLRPEVVERSVSLMASFHDTVNRLPACLPMGVLGESIYQWSVQNRKSFRSEAVFLRVLLDLFRKQMFNPAPESAQSMSTGIGLALGGTRMTLPNLDAWLTCIVDLSDSANAEKMKAMILGVCRSGGHVKISSQYLQTVLRTILASAATVRPSKITAMLRALCDFLGNGKMSVENRDGLIETALANFRSTGRLPVLEALIDSLSSSFGGEHMSKANREALVTQIVGLYATGVRPMSDIITGIVALCEGLGGPRMSAQSRDLLLTSMLASHATGSPEQMRTMITSLCITLGDVHHPEPAPEFGLTRITRGNLAAVIDAILAAHATCTSQHIAAMMHGVYISLGGQDMPPMCRDVLMRCLQDCGHMPEIVTMLKQKEGGRTVLEFLQIDNTDDSASGSAASGDQGSGLRADRH